jgi:hypothetical protein
MKLVTTLLIASTLAENANWFTNLFESAAEREVRIYNEQVGSPVLRAQFAEACNEERANREKAIRYYATHDDDSVYPDPRRQNCPVCGQPAVSSRVFISETILSCSSEHTWHINN